MLVGTPVEVVDDAVVVERQCAVWSSTTTTGIDEGDDGQPNYILHIYYLTSRSLTHPPYMNARDYVCVCLCAAQPAACSWRGLSGTEKRFARNWRDVNNAEKCFAKRAERLCVCIVRMCMCKRVCTCVRKPQSLVCKVYKYACAVKHHAVRM